MPEESTTEKIEIARRGIDAFNRGDVEALAADTTEDVELFAALAGAVEGGGFHGRAGIEAYFQITAETWSEFRILAEDFSNLGDRVLVAGRIADAEEAAVCRSKRQTRSSWISGATRCGASTATSIKPKPSKTWQWRRRRGRTWRSCCGGCWRFAQTPAPSARSPIQKSSGCPLRRHPSRAMAWTGALQLRDQWLGVWDEQSIAIEEIWGQGDDVFLEATLVARGKASGTEIKMRFYAHCRVRDHKVSYCYEYLNRDEALKAVGLDG